MKPHPLTVTCQQCGAGHEVEVRYTPRSDGDQLVIEMRITVIERHLFDRWLHSHVGPFTAPDP